MPFFWQRTRGTSEGGTDPSAESLLRGPQASPNVADNVRNETSVALEISSGLSGTATQHGSSDRLCQPSGTDESADEAAQTSDNQQTTVIVDIPRVAEQSTGSAASSTRDCTLVQGADRTDSLPACLICLEVMDISDTADIAKLGCQCKGAAAYRHQECLNRWLHVKGDTLCDICGTQMASVSLPPPPPVPGYVVFPDLEHTFEVQWETFGRYLWHNAVAVFVYCLVLALLMDIKIIVAAMIAGAVISLVVLRYLVSVAVNSFFGHTVLSFQTPEMS
jgi:hypothetical protein